MVRVTDLLGAMEILCRPTKEAPLRKEEVLVAVDHPATIRRVEEVDPVMIARATSRNLNRRPRRKKVTKLIRTTRKRIMLQPRRRVHSLVKVVRSLSSP